MQYAELMKVYVNWAQRGLVARWSMEVNSDGIEHVQLSFAIHRATRPRAQIGPARPSGAKSRRRRARLEAYKKAKGDSVNTGAFISEPVICADFVNSTPSAVSNTIPSRITPCVESEQLKVTAARKISTTAVWATSTAPAGSCGGDGAAAVDAGQPYPLLPPPPAPPPTS